MDDLRILRQALPATPVVRPNLPVSFSLWLEFEWWQPEPNDDLTCDFFNMQITLSDQRVYALNVWTFNFFTQVSHEQTHAKNGIAASFLLPPDLFVERLDRPLLEDIVAELIRTDTLRTEWLVPPSDDADNTENNF